MAATIRWTLPAADDFEAIFEYLVRDAPLYAKRFSEDLLSTVEGLLLHPSRGWRVPELHDENCREVLVDSYRLVYCELGDVIEVAAIIHMSRDFASAWQKRE